MANGHGGARPGAGRKKKALSEKIMDGNPGKAPLTKLQFEIQKTDMHGEDMPPVAEYLKQVTKNSQKTLHRRFTKTRGAGSMSAGAPSTSRKN